MAMGKIVIGLERLPTLEIMGKEYPYDISSEAALERLQNIDAHKAADGAAGATLGSVVDACKEFMTTVFCGDTEPVERIAAVYKDSALLWLDAAAQIGKFAGDPKITALSEKIGTLKRAASK